MASKPGILTDWPWKPLGTFKYLILAPWVIHSTYSYAVKEENDRDLGYFIIFPFLLLQMLHNQIWISLSRYQTAKGSKRIVDKGIDFDQVDREQNWDDYTLLIGILLYVAIMAFPQASHLPIWRTNGVILTILLHAGPVEFLYYWLHRALHHHYLYSRYHSHHHSSIVTQPISAVNHPFAEIVVYFVLFLIPMVATLVTNTASILSIAGYVTYVDFMNNMGHCNFEHIPKSLFSLFPLLKYIMYTPSFHSLHHTKFWTNYSLFMPIYDYIYNTMDISTDIVYESSLARTEETPDVVHLVHLTAPPSIYHLQLGFASFASHPYSFKWYLWLMWPFTTFCSAVFKWFYGSTFISESISFKALKLQSWVVPKYQIQYSSHRQKKAINNLIEKAIVEADAKGVKVLSLGLLNQGEDLNMYGKVYLQKYPSLKIKVVDGSSLAVAVVLNSIPKSTNQVVFRGKLTKVASAIALALCQREIQVATLYEHEKKLLELELANLSDENHMIHLTDGNQKIWLVGDELTKEEQLRAPEGTLFIPFSQFPPKKLRGDCLYHTTPAMIVPKSFENLHSCENWLPRRVTSAWRIAGILHALEEWDMHECGNTILDVDKVWEASLNHGFRPLINVPPLALCN